MAGVTLAAIYSCLPSLESTIIAVARCEKKKKPKYWREKTHISRAHDSANLLHGVQVGAQTTVHGENLLVNDGGNGEAVEAVGEGLPELDVVSALALIVESINTVDRGALVVTAENEEVFGVLDLVGKEQANSLKGLLSTVDVVTEEQVVGLRGETTVFEQTEEIVVLTVDITTDLKTNTQTRQKKRAKKSDQHTGGP